MTGDLRAEHKTVIRIGDDLHEAFVGAKRQCAAIDAEREFADLHVMAFLLRFLLAVADASAFRIGEADSRNTFVINFAWLSRNRFSSYSAFIHRFVRKRRTRNDIADRIDMRNVRAALIIHFNQTAICHLHIDQIQTKLTVRIRTTADGYEQIIRCYLLLFAANGVSYGYVFVGLLGALSLSASYDFDACPFKLLRNKLMTYPCRSLAGSCQSLR